MDVLVLIDKLDDLVHNAKAVPLTDQGYTVPFKNEVVGWLRPAPYLRQEGETFFVERIEGETIYGR
jgi:hypothetical protein